MTDFASIVANLIAVSTALDGACKQLIATVQAMPEQGNSTPTEIDLKQLADHTLRHTSLVREVAGRLDMAVLAQEFDTSDIAGAIDLSDLASEISARHIADEIDLDDLCDKCVDAMSSDIDTEEIARKAAEEIDAAAVAQELDISSIAEEVASTLDMDELAERVEALFDTKELAQDIGNALTSRVCKTLATDRDFIEAVARAMAEAMLRGSEPQEPHGARDTFVPASEGPDGEQCNAMQD